MLFCGFSSYCQAPDGFVLKEDLIKMNSYYRDVLIDIKERQDSIDVISKSYFDSLDFYFGIGSVYGPCFEKEFDSLKLTMNLKKVEETMKRFQTSLDSLYEASYKLYEKEFNILFIELSQKLDRFGAQNKRKIIFYTRPYKLTSKNNFTSEFNEYLQIDTIHLKPQDYQQVYRSCY